MRKLVNERLERLIDTIRKKQSSDGSWDFPFETGISTDCYTIILLRSLGIDDEHLISELVERIINKQEANGAWKLFYDEGDGNLTITVEAYYALLYSEKFAKTDLRMRLAEKFILSKGGIGKAHMFTKMMLSITGQHRWPTFFPFPVELILLPTNFPVHFYSLSVYGRANLAPVMILAAKQFSIRTAKSPDLSHLFKNSREESDWESWSRSHEWRSFHSFIKEGINKLIALPEQLHTQAIEQTKKYILNHIEPDGTFFSYFSSTFLMIFALLSLGYPKNDPIITKAVDGIKSMKTKINGKTHIQYTTADVWNTSLFSFCLQKAGVTPEDTMIKKANQYLLSRQQKNFGDWIIDNPNSLPGGWGFSDVNTINPDVDDTSASLRSIVRLVNKDPNVTIAWEKGIRWLVSMQNNDGGWASFERNKHNRLLTLLPIQKGEFILIDPSSADLTGRTLEFLGHYTKLAKQSPIITKGIRWLIHHQEKNGSWYSRWGICYIYGAWSAITGLKAAGIPSNHDSIKKAARWLAEIQNHDGGWGESCHSDQQKKYVPLGKSTIVHTSWALDALIAAGEQPNPSIEKGMRFLIQSLDHEDWTTSYPTGQGMAGDFYVHYHSYRYIFPLLTLANYKMKLQAER